MLLTPEAVALSLFQLLAALMHWLSERQPGSLQTVVFLPSGSVSGKSLVGKQTPGPVQGICRAALPPLQSMKDFSLQGGHRGTFSHSATSVFPCGRRSLDTSTGSGAVPQVSTPLSSGWEGHLLEVAGAQCGAEVAEQLRYFYARDQSAKVPGAVPAGGGRVPVPVS